MFVSFLGLTLASQDDCPPWFFPEADNGTECVCSSYTTMSDVKCSKDGAFLRIGVCMTYNNITNVTEIGTCPYISQHIIDSSDAFNFFRLPKTTSNLTSFMCGSLHRKGLLCGECEDGFGPALYSNTLECKKCWGHGFGLLLYITLTVIPTTVLYFILVIFHISASSPPLNAFVLSCHITVYTFRFHPTLYWSFVDELSGSSSVLLKVTLGLSGLWNLDFFRLIVPPFCVSPNMKNLYVLTLEYTEAFYPLILILITYICIKLHYHNFRPVILLWKPFHRCFVYFRRSWDYEAFVINAFATFLLLSFSKILFISYTLLYKISPDALYGNGTSFEHNPLVLYYDSTVQYFGNDHLPFVGVSTCVILVLIVFPTLLLILYPTRIFRKCITCCGFRRWHALHTFMEAFQGHYKDGTNGTWDFRIVSALYLIFRIAALFSFSDNHSNSIHAFVWLKTSMVLVSTSLFFAIIRPYKANYFNTIDSILLGILGFLFLIYQFVLYLPDQKGSHTARVIGVLLVGFPHAALVLYVLYVILKKTKTLQYLKRKYQCLLSVISLKKHSFAGANNDDGGHDTDSLPDRLVNPDEYEPLIPTVNQRGTDSDSDAVQARVTPMNTYGIVG